MIDITRLTMQDVLAHVGIRRPVKQEVCDWCNITIDEACDEAHKIEHDGEDYTVCDSCFNDHLVGRVPVWV